MTYRHENSALLANSSTKSVMIKDETNLFGGPLREVAGLP